MRTRDIEVWVKKDSVNFSTKEVYEPCAENINKHGNEYYKAKLIIEIPEEKFEITKDELLGLIDWADIETRQKSVNHFIALSVGETE